MSAARSTHSPHMKTAGVGPATPRRVSLPQNEHFGVVQATQKDSHTWCRKKPHFAGLRRTQPSSFRRLTPVPHHGLPPIDLDPNRDLAEQLSGKTFGPATVIEAKGSRGTRADGSDVYNLELELEIRPPVSQRPEASKAMSGVVPDPFRCQGVHANAFEAGTFRRLNVPRVPTISEGLLECPRTACAGVGPYGTSGPRLRSSESADSKGISVQLWLMRKGSGVSFGRCSDHGSSGHVPLADILDRS